MSGLSRHGRQAGIALLESLVALAILATALLGVLVVQLRTLADAESALRRTQALRLIEDLAERIQSNPTGFAQLANYRSDWRSMPSAATDCEAQRCDSGELAQWDLAHWKAAVARALPLGDAAVYDVAGWSAAESRRALGVTIGWRARVRTGILPAPESDATCPPDLVCQHGHVQP